MTPSVLLVIGTRPDIIKMHPVYLALKEHSCLQTLVLFTGQHQEMATSLLQLLDWQPDLGVTLPDEKRRTLANLTSALTEQIGAVIERHHPQIVLTHGDVVTALAAAQAGFLEHVPVGHVEAGLRTSRFEEPFPEEGIRRTVGQLATLHFAPTAESRRNLLQENIPPHRIFVTGNTVVDSLCHVLAKPPLSPQGDELLQWINGRAYVLITCHRRESWGQELVNLAGSIRAWAIAHPEACFIWPVHDNPRVRERVQEGFPQGHPGNVRLCRPLDYRRFTHLLAHARLVITDSGGVLEEATVLGKRTLVLRHVTERPEALERPEATLVGYNFVYITELVEAALAEDRYNLFTVQTHVLGDGHAGEKIADIVLAHL